MSVLRLCSFSSVLQAPKARFQEFFVFEHGVEDDQELAHAGGVDDFEFLAVFFQTLGEGLEGEVMRGYPKSEIALRNWSEITSRFAVT